MVVSRRLQKITPVRLCAEVIHGFGRGSKQLGFPTANMRIRWDLQDESTMTAEERAVLSFAKHHETGIYCAFGVVEGLNSGVHNVAMSMGWNPTFSDVKAKTIEPWILHSFAEDFYGKHLRLLILGYVRPELKFESLEELITEIRADGDFCANLLESPEFAPFKLDEFLQTAAVEQPGPAPLLGTPLQPGTVASARLPLGDVGVGSPLQSVLLAAPPLHPDSARLLLVRHGEASANEQGLLCGGGNDSELTTNGLVQVERLAVELASSHLGLRLDLVGSSPLRRAAASAEAIAQHFPKAARLTLEDLREMAYGTLEGARIADVRDEMAVLTQKWRDGVTGCRVGEGGESPEDVAGRALRALAALLEQRCGHTVLLVCHSWVIKAVVASVAPGLGLSRLLEVPQRNCAVNLLDFRCQGHGNLSSRFQVLGVDLSVGEGMSGRL